jgi:RHS repeat-associated protein
MRFLGKALTLGMAFVLVVTLAPVTESAAAAPIASWARDDVRFGPAVAADLESALLTARLQQRPIRVADGGPAAPQAWAQPDGTLTLVRAGAAPRGPAGWKRITSSRALVRYAPPLAAPRVDVGPAAPGAPRRASSLAPVFSAVVAAPAGDNLRVEFELYRGDRRVKRVTKRADSGATVTVTPTDFGLAALRARTTYAFRARLRGAHTDSPWSSRVQVVADPATATPAAAVAPAAPAYLTAAAAATVAVTSPEDGDTTVRRLRLTATGTTGYTGARFQYRRGETDTWKDIPAGNVVTAATSAAVTWPVAVTNGLSTPLIWTATSTLATDGTVSVRAVYSGTAGTLSSSPVDVLVDRNAATATDTAVGPGAVNLLTGDYTLTATDVSLFGATVTRTASSRRPALGASQDGQVPIFGPQWTSGVIVTQTQSLYTGIRPTSTTSVQVLRVDGDWVDFTATTSGGWAPQPGADDLTLTGSLTGSFVLTDNEGASTTFVKTSSTDTAWQVSTTYLPTENSTTKVVSEAASNGSRPTMIISPTPAVAAATCQTAPHTRGCRVLQFVYATATTATGTTPGDYAGRVKQILQWATSPGATASTSVAVAAYAYDTAGRLAQSWDPRISPALKTAYAYDSAGRVVGLTPPGELPWTFTYGTAGGTAAAGDGMLLKASRPSLAQGSASTTDGGTATSWLVYGVPLSGSAAPHAMSGADVAAWGQSDAPTDATAVFAAGELPASHTGSDAGMYPTDYWYATVTYLDAVGREVNTATPGGHLSAVNYDQFGNVVWQLSASNRDLALSTSGDEARLATLGLSTSTPAQRAALLATTSVYSADGGRQLEQYGPLHMVNLAGDLYTEGKPYLSPGAWVPARQHTVHTYDGGRPTDGSAKVSGLVTRTATGAAVPGYTTDGDIRIAATTYDWTTGRATAKVTDPDGLAITTTMAYDSQGRIVKTTLPKANGTDAGTTTTAYWSATGSGTCAGRPEWAGLVCQVAPGGAITGGGANPTSAPTRTTEYGRDGAVTKATEVAGSVTRTTTSTHDAAGRLTSSAVTGGIGAAVPSHTVTYASNGRPASVAVSGGATTTYTYDALGRMIGYNDGAGGVTALAYDALDRLVKVSNNIPSSTTYTYDPHEEPRGMPVSVTDSVAGTFTATYDADGEFRRQTMPGGVTLEEYRDEAGNPIERQYHSSSGAVLAYDWVDRTVHDQWASRTLTSSTSADLEYRYDAAGRLTGADDTRSTVCTARTYVYDADANRTASTTATAAAGAGCPSGGTVTAHAYDSAGRLVDAGYAYDAFARTTTAPGTTLEYYANDLVQRQTVGAARQTWTLDTLGRIGTSSTEARNASGVWQATGTTVNHYVGNGDSPAWITDSASGNVSRLVAGPEGHTAATTGAAGGTALLLTDLHGDVIVRYTVDTGAASAYGFDEFGNPRTGQTATQYGWLGGFERSAATPSGVILMGVRLYAPTLGRFLQVDPVRATDTNAYDYAGQDPLAKQDLGGLKKKVWKKRWGVRYGVDIYYNRRETKDLRNFWDAATAIVENFYRTAPWWWVRDIIEGVFTYAARLAALATIASKTKRCVYFVIRVWGQASTYIYGPGDYCK